MMMNRTDVASEIRVALAKLPGQEFAKAATDLLAVLGYNSALMPDGQTALVDDFIQQYPATTPGTQTEESFRESADSIRVLFQYTDQEIAAQGSLLDVASFDTGNARSFLFAAVDLKEASYPRGDYSTFAREINKRWQIPTVVLFKTSSDLLSLAFVHRRPNRRDPDRDVLGSVSLIREITPSAPHRAHLDILSELSLAERLRWMNLHGKPRNFDGLLDAWLDALDTEELNRRFYRELKEWFDRAVKESLFPNVGPRILKPEEHVIRLITRMLFVWFIKEKGLVAEDLFVENQIAPLLKDYDRAEGDSYYRAVLQNLFFATLNTEIDRRSFSSQSNASHRDFSRYRYSRELANPDALRAYFAKTPFINGGLFDCLDSEEATRDGGYRIDYFSDNVIRKGTEEYGKLSIPNRMFFDTRGLITLFNHYKFTVEENTPAEQEVALDPELLGKVFENLLAAYNPETRETARKQTGSYYTPRVVVDYMVDEAIVSALIEQSVPRPTTAANGGRTASTISWTTVTPLTMPMCFSIWKNARRWSGPLLGFGCSTLPWGQAPSQWAFCTSLPLPCGGWTRITSSGRHYRRNGRDSGPWPPSRPLTSRSETPSWTRLAIPSSAIAIRTLAVSSTSSRTAYTG